ncbi:hypothetical protein [Flexivirga caeni]|uniref:HNH endonuclease n=1 Tax=Flexivirga caeni TaxID=2294115 RepID=A0A3M9M759_9MICO|nr:hypothetical protein [Flexivirga caeni]RNI21047.1 hypothetical protein EFY87_12210 [Flexivirga caeni]
MTDPVTGVVIDAANTYRVPAGMARLVKARDHTCRAPGDCGVTAAEADLDHDTAYQPGAQTPAAGGTHPQNLHAAHRGHHQAKTGRFWTSEQHEDASITWRTLTRRVTTTPFDHHRPEDHSPPAVSWAEQRFGIHLALTQEPDLHRSVFTDIDDMHVLTDVAEEHEPHRRQTGRIQIFRCYDDIRVEYPEPPPPF